ncbi:PaaI family thioesterase [Leptospira sp. 201903070]|uniref:PaaI family thioesterase n=1 Tax=Leptospira ainlahdjerensis TaxID=2810033 RepID=A0ABS2UA20_9LEPT|nr:PaaI family thioesterase [Leptospira ainlahdjerensis]MBM9577226.1 PaaI family thioesterase [Leptospira ainlahdjerensis]
MNPFQSIPEINFPEFIFYFQTQNIFSYKLEYKALHASFGKSMYEIEMDETFHNSVKIVHRAALFGVTDISSGAAMRAWINPQIETSSSSDRNRRNQASFERAYIPEKLGAMSEITDQKGSTVLSFLSPSIQTMIW